MDALVQALALGAAMGNEKILAKLANVDLLAFDYKLRKLRKVIVDKNKESVKEILENKGVVFGDGTIIENLLNNLTRAGLKAKQLSIAEQIGIAAKICTPEEFRTQIEKLMGECGELFNDKPGGEKAGG